MSYIYNEEYENRLEQVIEKALDDYPRTLAVRLDLRLPNCEYFAYDSDVMKRFIASLTAQIKAHERRKSKTNHRVHKTRVRYVWVRERNSSHNDHYHLLLLFNHDAYFRVGSYNSSTSLAYRIIKAWASALGIDIDDASGLVHFALKGEYQINTHDDNFEYEVDSLFERARYLCKFETKNINPQYRSFGYSYR